MVNNRNNNMRLSDFHFLKMKPPRFWIVLIILLYTPLKIGALRANLLEDTPVFVQAIANPNQAASLVNSIHFHPSINLFCVTFTHNHQVIIYRVDEFDRAYPVQVLSNPISELNHPQHAIFSRDGKFLIVANWSSQSFAFFRSLNGGYEAQPCATISFKYLNDLRPHGIAISSDGNYFAVAFGASKQNPKAVALYRFEEKENQEISLDLVDMLQNEMISQGIPKGIAFSPDNTHLIITFSETNKIAIFEIDLYSEMIHREPVDVLEASFVPILRPEDIKFNVEGNCCAISNSQDDSVLFVAFDFQKNRFLKDFRKMSCRSQFHFPHGLSFSPDGKYFAVSHFGQIGLDHEGVISWGNSRGDGVALYRLK